MRKAKARRKQRWVVKAGSNIVCTGGPLLLRAWMQQLAILRERHGIEVIWVTSGAIATAVERMRLPRSQKLAEKQALSAIGQPLVMDLYLMALQAVGLKGAQVLLTYDDLANPRRHQNFQATLETLLKWEVTPVLNENDAVATEEIRFGDNDSLSAKVASVSGADRLVILTDVPGVYDRDPRQHPDARLLERLDHLTPASIRRIAGARAARAGPAACSPSCKRRAKRAGTASPPRSCREISVTCSSRSPRASRAGRSSRLT